MINFVANIHKAAKWISNNSTDHYVHISSTQKKPYCEVSGYYIPTLLNYGFREKAIGFADYLQASQFPSGAWRPKIVFDAAQVVEGLSEFGDKYSSNIKRAVTWILTKQQNGRFIDYYYGEIEDHIYMRVMYCLVKSGVNIEKYKDAMLRTYYNENLFRFAGVSHFYAYGFEGAARLGMDCKKFMDELSRYQYIPEKPGVDTYCFTGLSQIALSLFLIGEYDLGMKYLQFVTGFQRDTGGFLGSNGTYFPKEEISWAVKFYMDAFLEGQRLWFKNNIGIFPDKLEYGDRDERFIFVNKNVRETDDVLEVGCGKGRYINNLKCNRFACDIADASKYVNAKFQVGSCLRLPYEDNTFNVVFASEVLEHSIFVDNAIKECLRVVKPGGKLLIIDKDNRINFKNLHFGEKWLEFKDFQNKYAAEIADINQFSVPFCTAKINKE
jgi:malonyl-CoA O-methyltransferase